jgi:peptidoglycan/LPS O-acetylase OafA/YrhL
MGRLHGLDALRGIAALVVLWFHLHLSHNVSFYPHRGDLAVDFFFMLSGYVMARTYEGRMQSGIWFLRKRVRRLVPTVTVGSLIGLIVLWGAPDFGRVAAFNLLLIPTLWTVAIFPLNTPIWSIFFELFANAVHGFWLHRVRTLHLAVMVWAAAFITLGIALRVHKYSIGSNADDFLGGFPRVTFAYFLGVILWRTWQDCPPIRLHPALLIPIGAFLFTPREPVTAFLFVALACPMIIAIGLSASPGRWASFVGKLSFPLYAVHRPILAIAAALGTGWYVGASGAILVAAVMLLPLPRILQERGKAAVTAG